MDAESKAIFKRIAYALETIAVTISEAGGLDADDVQFGGIIEPNTCGEACGTCGCTLITETHHVDGECPACVGDVGSEDEDGQQMHTGSATVSISGPPVGGSVIDISAARTSVVEEPPAKPAA